jgi:3-hydroxybutyrate dehydrogenase
MKQKGWGRIINVASTHGLVASTHKIAYVAAKHGLIGLTKVMGIECADTGVTCNAICPGFVSAPLALGPDRDQGEGRQHQPWSRRAIC